MTPPRLTAVAVATLAAAYACSAVAVPAGATTQAGCATAGYSYRGVRTAGPQRGISAQVTAPRIRAVTSGHIAGWVGVGGADERLQVGISSVPGGETEIYYEVAQAGGRAVDTKVAPIAAGDRRVLGVYEIAPATWVATVDGVPVTKPVLLPGSHGTWHGTATAESYDGGAAACDTDGIQLTDLRVADDAGLWQPITDAAPFSNGS